MGVEREFRIRITSDASSGVAGANAAAGALDNVTKATERAGEATKEHGEHFVHAESKGRAFHKVLHEITQVAPEFGIALRLGMDQAVAGMLGAGLALQLFERAGEAVRRGIEDLSKELSENFARKFEAAAEAIDREDESAQKFVQTLREMVRGQTDAKIATDAVAKSLELQEQAQRRVLKAEEEAAVARETTEEGREQVRQRFHGRNQALTESGLAAQIAAKQDEMNQRNAAAPDLFEDVANAEENAIGGRGTERKERMGQLQGFIKTILEGNIPEATKAMLSAPPGSEERKLHGQSIEAVKRDAQAMQEELQRLKNEEAAAQAELERSRNAYTQNEKGLFEGNRALGDLQTRYGVERATGGVEQAYAGATVMRNQGQYIGADIAGAAGRIATGTAEGTAAVPEFAAALAALGLWPLRMQQMSQELKKADAAFQQTINDLAERTSAMEGQISNLRNH